MAPHEKINLCAAAKKETDPLACLQGVAGPSRNFHKSPKNILGYFLDSIHSPEALNVRSMLINMCSFSASLRPLAAGICFLHAPTSLNIVDAISLCTNVTTLEDEHEADPLNLESDPLKGSEVKDEDNAEEVAKRAFKMKQDGLSLSVYLEM